MYQVSCFFAGMLWHLLFLLEKLTGPPEDYYGEEEDKW
jgi:hypothetical protein